MREINTFPLRNIDFFDSRDLSCYYENIYPYVSYVK